MPTIRERFKNSWNAFFNNRDPSMYMNAGYGSSYSPTRTYQGRGNEKSIVNAIYNRIAMDVASVNIMHVKTDGNGRFLEKIDSSLNDCLNLEANTDQTGRSFIQDITLTLFEEGSVAVVPIDTDINPLTNDSFKIYSMRVGVIEQWYPQHVRVRVYNENTGQKESIIYPKTKVAIIENPLYIIMNEPNGTLRRLIHKLVLLDSIDDQSGSGKLDLIIQLPYVIKSEARQQQAEERRKQIEMQLAGSKYGIAYTDGTEHITQLNRPVENNLMSQIEYLTNLLYSQLGLTNEIMNGSANEETMLNYYNRTVEPILSAITDELKRKFITRTARSQGQSIMFFRDPFKLTPVTQIADIADKFTRNEILSSNEVRALVGFKPVDDAKADELRNKNINAQQGQEFANTGETELNAEPVGMDQNMASLDENDQALDQLERELNSI